MKLTTTILAAILAVFVFYGSVAMAEPTAEKPAAAPTATPAPASVKVPAAKDQTVRALMIVGGEWHDYTTLPGKLVNRLNGRGQIAVDLNNNVKALTAKDLKPYDVLIFNDCQRITLPDELKKAIVQHVTSGKGLVAIHCSLWSYTEWEEWDRMLGGRADGHDKLMNYDVVVLDPANAIMSGLGNRFSILDEPYSIDKRDPSMNVLIETAKVHLDNKGQPRPGPDPQVWTKRYGQGRVFVTTFGHDERSQGIDQFITLLHNGIRWAGGALNDTVHNQLTASEKKAGFELLFDGHSLKGWQKQGGWKVQDGELVGKCTNPLSSFAWASGTGFDDYEDFLLKFSFQGKGRVEGRFWTQSEDDTRVTSWFNVDLKPGKWGLLSTTKATKTSEKEDPKMATMSPTSVPAPSQLDDFIVENGWNDVTIQACGPKVTVIINGIVTSKLESAPSRSGFITFMPAYLDLKEPAAEFRLRDIRIRPIKPDELTTTRPG